MKYCSRPRFSTGFSLPFSLDSFESHVIYYSCFQYAAVWSRSRVQPPRASRRGWGLGTRLIFTAPTQQRSASDCVGLAQARPMGEDLGQSYMGQIQKSMQEEAPLWSCMELQFKPPLVERASQLVQQRPCSQISMTQALHVLCYIKRSRMLKRESLNTCS